MSLPILQIKNPETDEWVNIPAIIGPSGERGPKGDTGANGKDGVSATHSWNGTVLIVTSANGTSSADLKGDKGDKGDQGIQGAQGPQGIQGVQGEAGKDGYTPIRGTDYYTETDKQEMVAAVLAALPYAEEAVF